MKTKKLFILLTTAACMLGSFSYWGGIAPAEASVQIKGKTLAQITDIVATVTSSDFPEIQKHSILLYERFSNGSGGTRYQPRIFTVNNDGTMRKQRELDGYDINHTTESATEYIVQRMSLAMSNKRFGQRRNVMLTMPGMHEPAGYEYNVWGFRTIESNGTEDSADISLINPSDNFPHFAADQIIWGNSAMTVKGMESNDVFVFLLSSRLANTGDIYFKFFTSDRNETGNVAWQNFKVQGEDSNGNGWKLFDYSNGNRGAGIAAGDIDGDGYKNEIAVCFNDNDRVHAYVYRLTIENGQASVEQIYHLVIHEGGYWSTVAEKQVSPLVVTGDFNGDGKDEAAFVNKTFPQGEAQNQRRVTIIERNKDTGEWNVAMEGIEGHGESACKVTKCDFDGDGKDELAILFFLEANAALYPHLERWYCEKDSIRPRSNTSHLVTESILGYSVAGDVYNQYYKIAEDFCITAGPVIGTMGKAKLAEDIIISHVNSDASRVFVIPTQLDSSGRFAGFGETKKIYESAGSDSSRRGAVITADFANEGLYLDKPKHTVDAIDQSYGVVLQAMPYHVDNVDINGNLTVEPINYTFSGFNGDPGNGQMTIRYTKSETTSTQNDVSFNMASTTETIALLGDAGKDIADGMNFVNTAANIAGNFNPKAKTAAGIISGIMNFVIDKIDETTTNATSEVKQFFTTTTMEAQLWDEIQLYSAPQHIWRYKILNNPLPSWYQMGMKADYSSGNVSADRKTYYLTFSIYDDVETPVKDAKSLIEDQNKRYSMLGNQNNTYQARHEEGNFFSYPSFVDNTEGYNASGTLDKSVTSVTWTKNGPITKSIKFEQGRINSLKYDENIQPSELTKTISALAALFGAEDPNPLPPYTSHSETFQKKFSTSEQIDIELQGRSTEPGEEAGHDILVMPFLAREGTMKVATAVKLSEGPSSRLWSSSSLYGQLPDPALVLPMKYNRVGATIRASNNNGAAMQIRGMRYYVPALDLHSNNNLLAGLTYKIRVPIYNASFLDAETFDVRLSYVSADKFDLYHPEKSLTALHEIQTVRMDLGGWDNANSDKNKGWAEFTWDVPKNLPTGNYRFFVQIDPEGKLTEVHESRLAADGTIRDVGGNNDGYFSFVVTSVNDAVNKRVKSSSALRAANKSLPSDGVIWRAVYPGEKAEGNEDSVRAAVEISDSTGTINANLTFENFITDEDNIAFYMLLGLLADAVELSDDASVPVNCTLTYDGDEYYPEAFLYGINFKDGALENLTEDTNMEDIRGNVYLMHKIALVPHTTTKFVLNLTPRRIDWKNGSAFEIVVPELVAPAVVDDEELDPEPEPDPDPTPTPAPDPDTGSLGAPGGGCDAFSLGLLGLAGIAFLRKRKSR